MAKRKRTRERSAEAKFHVALMLSGRVAKLLGVRTGELPKIDDMEEVGEWWECWRCELITTHEPSATNYFLCTNPRTLLSFVIPNRDGDVRAVVSQIGSGLFAEMRREGVVIPSCLDLAFRLIRGQPRSLIGSQNELAEEAYGEMVKPNPTVAGINLALKCVPHAALEGHFVDEAFRRALAKNPPFGVLGGGG